MSKQKKVKGKVFFSSNRIYTILIFFFVFCMLNAQKSDNSILDHFYHKFRIHLAQDQDNHPVLFNQKKYVELDSIYLFKNNLNESQLINKLDLAKSYSVNVGPEIYLVSPDGSIVFHVDKQIGIKQLNNINEHKYYKCSIFSYGGSIYRIGGNDRFNHKSQLFKFDFKDKNWHFITTVLNHNYGFTNPKTVLVGNKVYVISRYVKNNFNNKRLKNDYVYAIDLNDYSIDKYNFDYTDFTEYFNEFFNKHNYFKVKNGIGFINSQDNSMAMIFDFKKKTSRLVEFNYGVRSDSKIIYDDNKLFFLDKDHRDPNQMIIPGNKKVHLCSSEISKIYKEKPFNKISFTKQIALLSFAFSAFFIIYIKRKRSPFLLEKKHLRKGNNSVKLDIDEKYFVDLLIKDGRVENQTLISYFDNDGKSYDLNVKRKNSMISKLSIKFYSQFQKDLFIKAPSTIDKRQGVYVLKQKLILANKKS